MNKTNFQLAEQIQGEDDGDTAALCKMAAEAKRYLESHSWCPPVSKQYLAYGVGHVVAVFFFELSRKINEIDDRLWVVVGDLPSAYLVVDEQDDYLSALDKYCEVMSDWVKAVRSRRDLREVFPVAASPSIDNANELFGRLEFIRNEIISPARNQSSNS